MLLHGLLSLALFLMRNMLFEDLLFFTTFKQFDYDELWSGFLHDSWDSLKFSDLWACVLIKYGKKISAIFLYFELEDNYLTIL